MMARNYSFGQPINNNNNTITATSNSKPNANS